MKVKKVSTTTHDMEVGMLTLRLVVRNDTYVQNLKLMFNGRSFPPTTGGFELGTLNQEEIRDLISALTDMADLHAEREPWPRGARKDVGDDQAE